MEVGSSAFVVAPGDEVLNRDNAITLVERRGNSVFYRVAAGDDTVALRMIDPA